MVILKNNINYGIWILIIIVVIPLLSIFVAGFVLQFRDFLHELRYLNCEIARTDGEESQQWIRQRRRLWLSLIPFIKY